MRQSQCFRPQRAFNSSADQTPRISDQNYLAGKLCVVVQYNVSTGNAFVTFKGFSGNACLRAKEIARAGWTELAWGNFLVADVEKTERGVQAVNVREATTEDFAD